MSSSKNSTSPSPRRLDEARPDAQPEQGQYCCPECGSDALVATVCLSSDGDGTEYCSDHEEDAFYCESCHAVFPEDEARLAEMALPIASSWIAGSAYSPQGEGRGQLRIHLARGGVMVYESVPSWVRGLLHAGVTTGDHNSSGSAYNHLVKGRYDYSRIAA